MNQFDLSKGCLCSLLVLMGCSGQHSPEISGVYGSVKIDSRIAAPGTLVSFINRENDSDAFTTVVGADGKYEYAPPAKIVISPGEFIAVIRPQNSRTVEDSNGMPQAESIPGAPKSYGKYSDVKKSDLSVQLGPGKARQFDIAIQTSRK